HPFEDGNGRIHRFLIHDTLVRRGVVPGGMALPVSAAILEDMAAYDRTLEAYSTVVGEVARYTLTDGGVLTVTNPDEAAWVWRYPDLTPQVEYLGRAMDKAVQMVPEEVNFLIRYDELLGKAKQVVDMPDARLAELLSKVHENGGTLSNNKRKQRFKELTDSEVAQIEAAYADVFGLRSGRGEAEDADA
ncbi:MAG TPA: Fic family protein, partial [Rariglobus sp.]